MTRPFLPGAVPAVLAALLLPGCDPAPPPPGPAPQAPVAPPSQGQPPPPTGGAAGQTPLTLRPGADPGDPTAPAPRPQASGGDGAPPKRAEALTALGQERSRRAGEQSKAQARRQAIVDDAALSPEGRAAALARLQADHPPPGADPDAEQAFDRLLIQFDGARMAQDDKQADACLKQLLALAPKVSDTMLGLLERSLATYTR